MKASMDRRALAYALLSFVIWGLFPVYWKLFGAIPPLEIISHRLLWSLVFLGVFAAFLGRLRECVGVARRPRLLALLFLSASLLSVNWGVFIYAVSTSQVVEASLGYFINPLVSVALGCVVLRERLSRWQVLAVILAAAGVAAYGWHLHRVPWIALGVALSFGFYGLLRKMIPVDSLIGLVVETAVMAPAAVAVLVMLARRGLMHFADSPTLALLFMGGGMVTAFPLLWFISAARRLPLSTLGILQYITPTLQLLTGVVIYRESFTLNDALAFTLIWGGILLFLASSRRSEKERVASTETQIPA
jgi:chloramphenicol-sensitive protein RarD